MHHPRATHYSGALSVAIAVAIAITAAVAHHAAGLLTKARVPNQTSQFWSAQHG